MSFTPKAFKATVDFATAFKAAEDTKVFLPNLVLHKTSTMKAKTMKDFNRVSAKQFDLEYALMANISPLNVSQAYTSMLFITLATTSAALDNSIVHDPGVNGQMITKEWMDKLEFDVNAFEPQLVFIDLSIYEKAQRKVSPSLSNFIAKQSKLNKTIIREGWVDDQQQMNHSLEGLISRGADLFQF